MKKITGLGLALALLFMPLQAIAAAGDPVTLDDVIRTVETPFKADVGRTRGIADFEGDFLQESRITSLDRVQKGRGRVTVKFDGNLSDRGARALFRWVYAPPTSQEIVSDGRKIWVYLPENRQVIETDIDLASEARPEDPLSFLTGLGNLSRDFRIAWAEPKVDGEENYVLELRPRSASALIERLMIAVDKEAVLALVRKKETGRTFPLLSTTVYDPNGNSTIIEFSDIQVNRGVDDSIFRFILPDGVEVMRPAEGGMGF